MQQHGRVLTPPPRNENVLQRVIVLHEFVVTKDIYLSALLYVPEQLLHDVLLHVQNCSSCRAPNEPRLQDVDVTPGALQTNADNLFRVLVLGLRLPVGDVLVVFQIQRVGARGLRPREPPRPVELALPADFVLLQVRHELVHDVLHGAVVVDVLQRVRLVYDDVARGARVALFQVLHEAALAEGVEALGDRGGVYQVTAAYFARDVAVQRSQFYFPLHDHRDQRFALVFIANET